MRRLETTATLEAQANPSLTIFVCIFMATDSGAPLPPAGSHCAHQVPTVVYQITIIIIIIMNFANNFMRQ
jgi:hypothetical protein